MGNRTAGHGSAISLLSSSSSSSRSRLRLILWRFFTVMIAMVIFTMICYDPAISSSRRTNSNTARQYSIAQDGAVPSAVAGVETAVESASTENINTNLHNNNTSTTSITPEEATALCNTTLQLLRYLNQTPVEAELIMARNRYRAQADQQGVELMHNYSRMALLNRNNRNPKPSNTLKIVKPKIDNHSISETYRKHRPKHLPLPLKYLTTGCSTLMFELPFIAAPTFPTTVKMATIPGGLIK